VFHAISPRRQTHTASFSCQSMEIYSECHFISGT
jgi:hypothetical protein